MAYYSYKIDSFPGSDNGALIQVIIGNFLIQICLGFLLSSVLNLHMSSDIRGREWMLHRFVTLPLLLPTSLAVLGAGLGSTFNYSSVISIIPAAIISVYILSKVSPSINC